MKRFLTLLLTLLAVCVCLFGCKPGEQAGSKSVNRMVEPVPVWSEGDPFDLSMLSDTFATHTDGLTGETVYRLTNSRGGAGFHDYEARYFRFNCLPAERGKVIVTETEEGKGSRSALLDLRTGELKALTDYGIGEGALRGNYFYYVVFGAKIVKKDLRDFSETVVYRLEKQYEAYNMNGVNVNADMTRLLVQLTPKNVNEQTPQSIMLILKADEDYSSYEFARYSEMFNHFDFSPVLPDLFFFVRGDADITNDPSERMYFADLRSGTYCKFELDDEYFTGDPFFPETGKGYTFTHPYWDYQGNFVSDILWNKADGNVRFRYLTIDFTRTVIDDLTGGVWTLTGADMDDWNIHHTAAGIDYPMWGTGSGGNGGIASFKDENGNTYTHLNLFRLTGGELENHVVGKIFGDDYARLGTTAWMLPDGSAVLTAVGANDDSLSPYDMFISDVYLYTIPKNVQLQMKEG